MLECDFPFSWVQNAIYALWGKLFSKRTNSTCFFFSFTLFECIGSSLWYGDYAIKESKIVSNMWFFFPFHWEFTRKCFAAKNNLHTKHLAKILFHLACCLQESMSTSGGLPLDYEKAANAVYISSVFLKHLIENDVQLCLSLDLDEALPKDVLAGTYNCDCFRFCKHTDM